MAFPVLSADEAAALIPNGEVVGISGLTPAGAPKAVPAAMARRALAEHAAGREYRISLFSGGSNWREVDGALSDADALAYRAPFQSDPDLRAHINACDLDYCDMHLSALTQNMRYGFLPRVRTAIVEVCEATPDGELTLTTSSSNSAAFCRMADRIILELNAYHKPCLRELHDIYLPGDYAERGPISISRPQDRIGTRTLKVDPAKIAGVVPTNQPDAVHPFRAVSELTHSIGRNIVGFLEQEYGAGRLPKELPPFQSGIGNVANCVLAAMAESDVLPPFSMFTEVAQDTVYHLLKSGRCKFISSSTITFTEPLMQDFYAHFSDFKDRIILRPAEISNNPELIRRMGVISLNTALEADITGHVNSTHLFGRNMMNGIGGSCEFARAAALSIFSCPSTAKGGAISSIVPMVSHVDQVEHDVDVMVTEQGVADLRGLSPRRRAELIIGNCAHPDYRPLLRRYMELTPTGHSPHSLEHGFCFHTAYLKTGDMRNAGLP
ncbi:MAG: acetyl-CoA hydrolase/transferase C-terminal domain-containing protein [Akkermansia sp.]|nr:acetyl-CoA hydrolase/transferase C-terminal domain-containing protein [Akkermansia sp.]